MSLDVLHCRCHARPVRVFGVLFWRNTRRQWPIWCVGSLCAETIGWLNRLLLARKWLKHIVYVIWLAACMLENSLFNEAHIPKRSPSLIMIIFRYKRSHVTMQIEDLGRGGSWLLWYLVELWHKAFVQFVRNRINNNDKSLQSYSKKTSSAFLLFSWICLRINNKELLTSCFRKLNVCESTLQFWSSTAQRSNGQSRTKVCILQQTAQVSMTFTVCCGSPISWGS